MAFPSPPNPPTHIRPGVSSSHPSSRLHLPPRAHSPPPPPPLLSPLPHPLPRCTPLAPLGSSGPSSPPLSLKAAVSEGQMTGELAPGRAPSHPGAIRLVANNRCFRPGEDQSGGIVGNVRSAAFYTSAQMDEITLVSF